MIRFVAVAALAAASCGRGAAGSGETLMVFAAASLRDVARDLAGEFEGRHRVEVVYNFAGSNTLAQQIRAASVADVFLSADERWIDYLDDRERSVPGSRRAVLSNRLVLIAHEEATFDLDDPRELIGADYRFLALADPEAVPAGRYARARLDRSAAPGGNVWQAVADRVAPAPDVRAALALVESDPEILGIVYRTDARSSDRVRVLHEFPPSLEMPIRYYAVLVADAPNAELGGRFLEFLESPEARAVAERHGFVAGAG